MNDDAKRSDQAADARSTGDGMPGECVDWCAALETTGGDEDLLLGVLEAMQTELPELFASMRDAFAKRDAELLHRAAHTARNLFRSIGASEPGDIAHELEVIGKRADFDGVPPLLEQLQPQVQQVIREVDRFLREKGRS